MSEYTILEQDENKYCKCAVCGTSHRITFNDLLYAYDSRLNKKNDDDGKIQDVTIQFNCGHKGVFSVKLHADDVRIPIYMNVKFYEEA